MIENDGPAAAAWQLSRNEDDGALHWTWRQAAVISLLFFCQIPY